MANDNKIVKRDLRARKLKKVIEMLLNNMDEFSSIKFRADFEYVIVNTGRDTYCIYMTTDGLYRIWLDKYKLHFKSAVSLVDFFKHTFLENN